MRKELEFAKDLMSFLDKSPSAFHAVVEMKERLEKAGFQKLEEEKTWKLKKNGKYYVTKK